MSALLELRRTLAERFPDALPLRQGLADSVGTGLAALDGLLPGGGLPRGRLTLWRPGGGATALLRSACAAAAARGERAAWVDGKGVTTADSWGPGPLLVRPGSERESLECAEELARCGGFALVVLAGSGSAVEREGVRLSRDARAGGSALVALAVAAPVAPLRVSSRLVPEGYRWRYDPFGEPVEPESATIEVVARSLGWSGRVRLEVPVRSHSARTALDPLLRDRRGLRTAESCSGRARRLG